MNRSRQRREGMPALELIEQAVHLLRRAPMGVLAGYYVGAVPFVLGLLYFWADMSRNAFAGRRCAEEALGLALLFFWMKCWQAVFAGELKARVAGAEPPRWTRGRLARLAVTQVILQSSAPFLLPLALLMMLPFGWGSAFYHNVAVLGDGTSDETRPVLRQAMQQARLWPRQNYLLILIVWLFGFLVMLNLASAVLLVPELMRILLGVETVFTLSGTHMLNTTFVAVLFGLTYLAVNPLMKACYVLRCFYGESVRSGADLKAQLRALLAAGTVAIALLSWVPDALGAQTSRAPSPMRTSSASARPSPPPCSAPVVSPAALDGAIQKVLSRPEYAWRMPREHVEEEKGLLASLLDDFLGVLRRGVRGVAQWIRDAWEWVQEYLLRRQPREREGGLLGLHWTETARWLLVLLASAVVAALALMLRRAWRRHRRAQTVSAEAITPVPDVADENVTADQLPADEWLQRARELMERGELRRALRALYLGSLAALAQQEMLVLARFKSNHDYVRELCRRAHARPETVSAFTQNVAVFDRIWYGAHPVDQETMSRFTANIERIRSRA